MPTQNPIKDHAISYANIAMSALSIAMVSHHVTKKVKKLSKLTAYPLITFANAIIAGYESSMAYLTLDNKTEGLTLLNTVHANIQEQFLNKEKLKKNIIDTFLAAFARQLKKIRKLDASQALTNNESKDDLLLQSVITGANLYFKQYRFFRAADRLFRRISSQEKDDSVKFIEILLGTKLAFVSASTSTLLINLNYLGKIMGGSLALHTHHFFGNPHHKKIIAETIPVLLSILFLYKELVNISVEYSFGLINNSLIYPLFAGIALGMHDEINPEILDNIGNFQNENMYLNRGQSIGEILSTCWNYAEHRYKKYEKYFTQVPISSNSEEIVAAILRKKPLAAKKFLAGHLAFYNLCKKYPSLEAIKINLITTRFLLLTAQTLLANAVFQTSRFTAPLIIQLGKKIRDALYPQQSTQNTLTP